MVSGGLEGRYRSVMGLSPFHLWNTLLILIKNINIEINFYIIK